MLSAIGAAAAARRNDLGTQLLLHMDDISQPTTFIDSSRYARTVTPIYGGTNPFAKSNTQYKFGNCSVYKSAYSNTTYPYFSVSGPLDWLRSDSRNYCIDLWIMFTALSTNKALEMFSTPSPNKYMIMYYLSSLTFYFGNESNYFYVAFTPTLNTWYHIAMTKVNNVGYGFVNGVLQNSIAVTPTNQIPANCKIFFAQENSGDSFQWYADEIRVSFDGSDYWTTNFTPPTSPYE